MTIADLLKKSQADAGTSQADFARRIGVSRQRLNNWAQGKAVPDSDILPSLCGVLGLGASEARALYAECGVTLPDVLFDGTGA